MLQNRRKKGGVLHKRCTVVAQKGGNLPFLRILRITLRVRAGENPQPQTEFSKPGREYLARNIAPVGKFPRPCLLWKGK